MPTQEPPKTRGSRGDLHTRPPDRGPPRLIPRGLKTSVSRPLCQPQAGAYRARPKKIVFEDELPSRPVLGTKKPVGSILGRHMPRPHSLPDYELKYPAVSSERERSRYVAVFQDQHAEFLELQQEVGSAQAKLQQLEALLTSLPAPRSQVSSQMETPTPQPFQVAGSGLQHTCWIQVSRPLHLPGWAGTTAHGTTSALEVLVGHCASLSLSFPILLWVQHP
uniref:Occludin/ELL domain containing 1 n=1 Tax=Rhinolophus ferrumequinum TaxID=59479 RepID=A0A671FM29_RHIFE